MAAPSKLPLPVSALAALDSVPANVFCTCLANLIVGGSAALAATNPIVLAATTAVAALFGFFRARKEHKQKEQERFILDLLRQAADDSRQGATDSLTALQLITDIAKGNIKLSAKPDPSLASEISILKSQIEDACRRIVAAPIRGLSDSDAAVILEALYRTATREQLHAFETKFDEFSTEARVLLRTQDHRGQEQGVVLDRIDERTARGEERDARMDTTLQPVVEILEQRTNETENQMAARLRPIIEKEVEARRQADFEQQRRNTDETVTILTKSVLRAADVPGLIEELRKTGDGRKIFEALRLLSTHSDADYIEVHRGVAEWAYLTGAIAAAESSVKNILHVHPNDLDAINRLGHIQSLRGDLSAAEDSYKRVLKLAGDDESLHAVAYTNLGIVYQKRGDLDAAEAMYKKALAINEKHGRLEGMAMQCGNLGTVYLTRGDLDAAEAMYKKSLAINENLGRLEGVAIAYANLGLVMATLAELDEARTAWLRSRDLFTRLGATHMVERVQRSIDQFTTDIPTGDKPLNKEGP